VNYNCTQQSQTRFLPLCLKFNFSFNSLRNYFATFRFKNYYKFKQNTLSNELTLLQSFPIPVKRPYTSFKTLN